MIQIECCDNLELMSKIESNTVDLIYCDILYGTGRNFMDYKDLYPIREIIEEHYIPRIKEMHRILKDSGSIYLQMDTKVNHWVRCILDDIFGYSNFKNEIAWKRGSVRGAKANSNQFARNTDMILFYTKSEKYLWNNQYKKYSEKFISEKFRKDKNGRLFRDNSLGDYSEISISEFEKAGKIYTTSNGKKRLIRYLDEEKGEAISDLWLDINEVNSMAKERTGYKTQKPKALIERIIKASSNEGDLVADFYLGSGTTAEVCKDLNRNFIGCDINPRAVEIANKRVEPMRSVLS